MITAVKKPLRNGRFDKKLAPLGTPRVQRTGFIVRAGKPDREDLDIVERIFGNIFGPKALETDEAFGLKRLAGDCPELYPAVVDEFAEKLPEDDEVTGFLRQLLAKTQLEKTVLRLAYDSNVDGLDCAAFHSKVQY